MSNRQNRQAEIDAMIAQMMTSEPVVKTHPKIKGEEITKKDKPLYSSDGAVIVTDNNEQSEEDEDNDVISDSDSESDNETGPMPVNNSTQSSSSNSSNGSIVNKNNEQESEAIEIKSPEDILDDFALERKIPISHQVLY